MYNLENVYYINLEEQIERKKSVEEQLNKLQWKYECFNAIKTLNGRIGCSMSHLKLLEMAKEKNLDYIVIIEDDIQFINPEFYSNLLEKFFDSKINYDVLLLAGNLREPYTQINDYVLKITKSWTTTGYIVKKHYYDKLINNITESIKLLSLYPDYHCLFAVDAYWQHLQKIDNWYILLPRTITQLPGYSSIEKRYVNYNHLMLDLINKN